ncbi:MAG: hypothetical protein AAGG08_00655 [Actinomycetota bacterium]
MHPARVRLAIAATAVIALTLVASPTTSPPAAATGGEPNCATGFDGPHCLGLGRRSTISGPGSERKMTDYWIVVVPHSRDADPADAAFIESLDGRWINGMCVQDNSFHPGGVITEVMTLAERYPTSANIGHEATLAVARFFLDEHSATGSNDQVVAIGGEELTLRDWYSGLWTYGHWVAQDRRAGVGGPTIGDFSVAPASSGARAGAAAIHRLGERYRLPWTSSTVLADHGDGTGSITTTVTSAAGHPVPGVSSRWDPATSAGATLTSESPVRTDVVGQATWTFDADPAATTIAAGSVSTIPRGTVTVFVGSGQDIAGWTERDQTTAASAASVDRFHHLSVLKTSSDPAVSVVGTEIVIADGDGSLIGALTVGPDGRTDTLTIDPRRNPPPYRWKETEAAPGLVARPTSTAIDVPLSTDPERPTVIEIENSAAIGSFRIEKTFSDPAVGVDRDLSGFRFRVTEVSTGDDLGEFTTGADGRTPPIEAVRGDHRVDEVGAPPWAVRLTSAGPITFAFDPLADDGVSIEYVNEVPAASVESDAFDPADGDQTLPWTGGTAVVTLTYDVSIVGDTYTGRVVGMDPATGEPIDGVTAERSFVATEGTGTVDIGVEIPGDVSSVVFVDTLLDASGRVIATHDDLADTRQTLTIEPPPTTTTTIAPPTTLALVPPSTSVPPTTTVPPPSTTSTTTTTSTTVPPATTTTTTTTVPVPAIADPPRRPLPSTGSSSTLAAWLILLAALVIAAGMEVLSLTERRPR